MRQGSLKVPFSVDYSLLEPQGPAPFPLLLAVHGWGQRAEQFIESFRPLAEKGILVAAPQAPNAFYVSLSKRKVGFTWLTRYERDRSSREIVDYLERFVELLRGEYDIDNSRIHALGFSQGSSVAYRFWLRSRVPVRAIFSCGADLPPDVEERLADRDPVLVRLLHGARDDLVPLEKPRHALERLREAGYDVDLKQYDAAHEVTSEMVEDVGGWMHKME